SAPCSWANTTVAPTNSRPVLARPASEPTSGWESALRMMVSATTAACSPARAPIWSTSDCWAGGYSEAVSHSSSTRSGASDSRAHGELLPFVGADAGYGHSRLRVAMGFANDRNGSSVPDNLEIGSDVDLAGAGCYPVWPYRNACSDGLTEGDNLLATTVAQNADSANRVDVVRIGPVFFGALVGFNYQIVKNFALFGELQIGGWLPNHSSMLIDLTVGPAITF